MSDVARTFQESRCRKFRRTLAENFYAVSFGTSEPTGWCAGLRVSRWVPPKRVEHCPRAAQSLGLEVSICRSTESMARLFLITLKPVEE